MNGAAHVIDVARLLVVTVATIGRLPAVLQAHELFCMQLIRGTHPLSDKPVYKFPRILFFTARGAKYCDHISLDHI